MLKRSKRHVLFEHNLWQRPLGCSASRRNALSTNRNRLPVRRKRQRTNSNSRPVEATRIYKTGNSHIRKPVQRAAAQRKRRDRAHELCQPNVSGRCLRMSLSSTCRGRSRSCRSGPCMSARCYLRDLQQGGHPVQPGERCFRTPWLRPEPTSRQQPRASHTYAHCRRWLSL
jgi:hypothetical protein